MTDARLCIHGHRIEGANACSILRCGVEKFACRTCIDASRKRNRERDKATNRELRRRANDVGMRP